MTAESIYAFSDYKRYLEAYLKRSPKAGRGILTQMATSASLTSAQMSHVMRGGRDFTPEQAFRIVNFLGLNENESSYFMELVRFARAGTSDLRSYSKKRIEELKAEGLKLKNQVPKHRELTEDEKAKFYSS
ncbi:MAG: TIGR02147 family protein, partial [Bdellovibrionota bacterium]